MSNPAIKIPEKKNNNNLKNELFMFVDQTQNYTKAQ